MFIIAVKLKNIYCLRKLNNYIHYKPDSISLQEKLDNLLLILKRKILLHEKFLFILYIKVFI